MASRTTIFVTGANAGLGLYTVKALYKSTSIYKVLLGTRDLDKATAAIEEVEQEYPNFTNSIDLQDDASIAQAFEAISKKHDKRDILLNNAGAQFDQQVPKGNMTTRDMWDKCWDVNVTGAYIVTDTFASLLLKSSYPRLVLIASGTSTLTELGSPSCKDTMVSTCLPQAQKRLLISPSNTVNFPKVPGSR